MCLAAKLKICDGVKAGVQQGHVGQLGRALTGRRRADSEDYDMGGFWVPLSLTSSRFRRRLSKPR
jgi:hypothetical protein